MEASYFLKGEELLTSASNDELVLTTHRLRHYPEGKGRADMVSFLLENIASVRVAYHSHLWLLILGILLIPAFGLGLILILIYFLNRKHSFVVTSVGGDAMVFQTRGMAKATIQTFVSKVEQAICFRRESLRG